MDTTTFKGLLTTIVLLTVFLNAAIIFAMMRKWKKLSAYDVTLLFLIAVEFFQSVIGYPIELAANLRGGGVWCVVAGYSTTTLALTSISILVALSLMRLFSVVRPIQAFSWLKVKRNSVYFILPSCLHGFLWGLFPLLGWSAYTLELGSNRRCTIDLHSKDSATISFLYCLTFFCYVLPLTIMVVNFYKIRKQVSGRRISATQVSKSAPTSSNERRLALKLFAMTGVFVVAWTPYAIAISFVGYQETGAKSWLDYSSLLAKSSTFFNPLVYVLMHKKCRITVLNAFQFNNRIRARTAAQVTA